MRSFDIRSIAFVALSSALILGCGGGQAKGRLVAGPMPTNGNFDGVYQSDFGRLELTVQGNMVVGLYEGDTHNGRIEGQMSGDLLSFSWVQWSEDMQGKKRESSGRGMFKYVIEQVTIAGGKTKESHRLQGTWGYGQDDSSNAWNAYKQSSMSKKKLSQSMESQSAEQPAESSEQVNLKGKQEEKQESQLDLF